MPGLPYYRQNRGFSLVETIVTLGIFALLIGSITAIYINSNQARADIFNELSAQGEARRALAALASELRAARQGDNGSYALETAGASNLIFYSNVDRDASIERVHYFLDGTTLRRGWLKSVGAPPQYLGAETVNTVARYVRSAPGADIFTYFGQTYIGGVSPPLPQPVAVTAVRVVGVSLSLDRDPNRQPGPFQIGTKAQLRNFKSN